MSNTRMSVVVVAASLLCAALVLVPVASRDGGSALATSRVAALERRDIAETIWFQGFLADVDTGEPVDAAVSVVAEMYDASTGGGSMWGPEEHVGVVVSEGWFHIELGSLEGLPEFTSPPYFLELTIDGETMDTRQKLASVPTAFNAGSFELPYYGIVSDQGTAFHVEQLGAGGSLFARTGGSHPAIVGAHSGSGVAIQGSCLSGTAGDFIGDVSVDGDLVVTGDIDVTGDLDVGIDGRVTVTDTLDALAVETYRFQMTRGPTEGMVLTCDNAGNGWWDWPTARTGLTEMVPVSEETGVVEAGDVMVIDPLGRGRTALSAVARSTLVAGVCAVSGGAAAFGEVPLAVVGIVRCKVSAENGAITAGDLLVTSDTPGHAMREVNPAVGTVLGKALEPLAIGTGMIRVLVTLQ